MSTHLLNESKQNVMITTLNRLWDWRALFISFGTSKPTMRFEIWDLRHRWTDQPEMRGIQEMSVIPKHVGVTITMSDYLEVLSICVLMKKSLMDAYLVELQIESTCINHRKWKSTFTLFMIVARFHGPICALGHEYSLKRLMMMWQHVICDTLFRPSSPSARKRP